jgi:hypothetical protein
MIENLTREQSIPRFGKTLSLSRRAASGTLTQGRAGMNEHLAVIAAKLTAAQHSEGSPQDRRPDRELEPELSLRRRLALNHKHDGLRLTCNRALSCALTVTFSLTDQNIRL